MKKRLIIAMLAIAVLVFVGCGGESGLETGPGGGTVFFSQNGQSLEVSGRLGLATWEDATEIVSAFRGGGFDNWRLPSQSELDKIRQRRSDIGGFTRNLYWSSTAMRDMFWAINFDYRDDSRTEWLNPSGVIHWGGQELRPGMGTFGPAYSRLGFRAIRAFRDESITATMLVIRNESFSGITDVIWNNVQFTHGEVSIAPGMNIELPVSYGTGFIFFRRVTDPLEARTAVVVTVQAGERREFTFLNNTLIEDQTPASLGDRGRFAELGRGQ